MKYYIYYLLFSFVFYMQNLIYSLFSNFIFVPNLLEFLLVYILVLIISKTPYPKVIFASWQILYLIHFSFISFFARNITSSDIYLFFTHIVETYETLAYTLHIYVGATTLSIFFVAIVFWIDFKKIGASIYLLLLLLLSLFFFLQKSGDASFLLLKALKDNNYTDSKTIELKHTQKLKPLRSTDIDIVLIIGESMRAKEYQDRSYDMFENYFYKSIYAGATSTDVSVPLLLNGAIKPSDIDIKNNLFTLAKQNNINTSFISVQSEKSMKYIKPYLNIKDIKNYLIVASRDDIELVEELKKIDFKKQTNLVVMQMQGEHSPYKYYPNFIDTDIKSRYIQSMNYSSKVIVEMLEHIKTLDKKTIFIFTSDHGELLGEGGGFGHNTFKEQVYKVPLVIVDNFSSDVSYDSISSHNDIYNLIYHHLGYSKTIKPPQKSIRVNGSMLNEEDGYKIFDTIAK